jgi:hypothetical protein
MNRSLFLIFRVIRLVRLDQQDSSPSPLLATPRSPIAFKQDLVRIMPEAAKLRFQPRRGLVIIL